MNWRLQFARYADRICLWQNGRRFTYSDLLSAIEKSKTEIAELGITADDAVFLRSDFNMKSISTFLALAEVGCIVVPHSGDESEIASKQRVAQCTIEINGTTPTYEARRIDLASPTPNDLTSRLRTSRQPGLILFTSGSAGEPKAILHSLTTFFRRYENLPQRPRRTAAFLLFDHIGGINTFLMTFATGGEVVALQDRSVRNVIETLRDSGAEVLPCSPTFLRLALTSLRKNEAALPELKLVTYGTEVMPQAILDELIQMLPGVQFKQTYGLSEIGILKTNTPDSATTWMKIGDETTKWRIVDGLLEIKTTTSMMGYLNAASPFTIDGWYKTGDRAEANGELVRVLGRESGIINVGGLKVLPSEIENFLSQMPEIEDVIVAKENHALLGEIVVAHLKIRGAISLLEMTEKVQNFCRGQLSAYKIPQKIVLHDESLFTSRFKKRNLS